MLSGHPTQSVRFLVLDGDSTAVFESLSSDIEKLAKKRNWLLGPPRLLEGVIHPEGLGPDEGLVGAEIQVYSSLPPWGEELPKDVDEICFQEACDFVEWASASSLTNGCDLDFFLDDVFVGQVLRGKPDGLLAEGLLGEWRKHL
jgi:hypothetical protein